MKGLVAESFADLIKEMWSGSGSLAPSDFKKTIGIYHSFLIECLFVDGQFASVSQYFFISYSSRDALEGSRLFQENSRPSSAATSSTTVKSCLLFFWTVCMRI
jgi:hypothetical protein